MKEQENLAQVQIFIFVLCVNDTFKICLHLLEENYSVFCVEFHYGVHLPGYCFRLLDCLIQSCRFLVKYIWPNLKLICPGVNGLFKFYKQEKIKEQERKLAEMQAMLKEKEKAQESLAAELRKKEAEMKRQMEKQKVRLLVVIFLPTMSFGFSGSYQYF